MKKIISLRDLAGFKPETLEQIKNISFYTDKSLFFGTLKVFVMYKIKIGLVDC